ncbi:hypothetical protein [Oceanobacillus sp. FSL K6-3682]|uniref:hypothetical protein n=1 Tax=Oceanobacillus sp. FSL K6-3682 TaxID=2921503 RepID=UPI0030DC11D9
MAIKIQTEKPLIPVEIGDLKFEFPVDDESIKKVRVDAPKLQKKYADIKPENDAHEEQLKKELMKEGFKLFLNDENAFDKIFEQTPSTVMCLKYFIKISEGITQELKEMGVVETPQEKAQKYVKKKNKK